MSWRAVESWTEGGWSVVDENDEIICDTNEANAKAIAKVPEMVELLQEAYETREPLNSLWYDAVRTFLKGIGELP